MGKRVAVKETYLAFVQELEKRRETDYLVVHHTASAGDIGAAEIHEEHKANGWAGCGYHYVIRFDGTVERGRPRDTVGAHAFGVNDRSIGIALSGNFMTTEPTDAQITSLENLLADLCDLYCLNQTNIIGHRDVAVMLQDSADATACPGDRLYERMDEIRQRVHRLQE